jgi:benzoyl-CoA reductase/2-hydroxyglutaryl-CoA dehydratase subunit BcrC/BadD/HgdB
VSQGFIMTAEDMGYSSDVCGYVKNDIGLWKAGTQGPFGGLPEPDLLLCTYSVAPRSSSGSRRSPNTTTCRS